MKVIEEVVRNLDPSKHINRSRQDMIVRAGVEKSDLMYLKYLCLDIYQSSRVLSLITYLDFS